jgi:LSD1 subclass zinc finger protein
LKRHVLGRAHAPCYLLAMASLVCATCRKLIPPGTSAIRCTVASCNTGRLKLRFCSVKCWEKHVPTARHRKASYAVDEKLPD